MHGFQYWPVFNMALSIVSNFRMHAVSGSVSWLTRSSWRAWPHRKLRRKVPSVDGAFTTQPMATPVPLVRSASASSMQSPPANADATRVSSLSPAFARPGASPKSTWRSTRSASPRCCAKVTGSSNPALVTSWGLTGRNRWTSTVLQTSASCAGPMKMVGDRRPGRAFATIKLAGRPEQDAGDAHCRYAHVWRYD